MTGLRKLEINKPQFFLLHYKNAFKMLVLNFMMELSKLIEGLFEVYLRLKSQKVLNLNKMAK